jgi:hypothetical protein
MQYFPRIIIAVTLTTRYGYWEETRTRCHTTIPWVPSLKAYLVSPMVIEKLQEISHV